jgi:hypothetical protein
MATGRSGPAHAVGHRSKMMTAMPGGVRLIPVAVRSASTATRTARPAKGRTVTLARHEYRYIPVPPEDRYEREAGKRYRRAVAKRIARSVSWVEPPAAQSSRSGIAQDFALRQRRFVEDRARSVGRRLGLTDRPPQPINRILGGRR